jgi:hypothetical protein
MNNINEMREELCKVFAGLKDGSLSAKDAKEMNNCMGKVINTIKVEIEYAQLCKTEANIPFMNYRK